MTEPRVSLAPAPILEWRCTPCPIGPLLATYTDLGGVHLKLASRLRRPLHYVLDLQRESLKAHCPACHAWRELYYDHEQQAVFSRTYAGPLPAIQCPDCAEDPALIRADADERQPAAPAPRDSSFPEGRDYYNRRGTPRA